MTMIKGFEEVTENELMEMGGHANGPLKLNQEIATKASEQLRKVFGEVAVGIVAGGTANLLLDKNRLEYELTMKMSL